jgi:hypothetical protein
MAAHLVLLCERSVSSMELLVRAKPTTLRIGWVSGGTVDVM